MHGLHLLLVTKHLGFLISMPRWETEGEEGGVRHKRLLYSNMKQTGMLGPNKDCLGPCLGPNKHEVSATCSEYLWSGSYKMRQWSLSRILSHNSTNPSGFHNVRLLCLYLLITVGRKKIYKFLFFPAVHDIFPENILWY